MDTIRLIINDLGDQGPIGGADEVLIYVNGRDLGNILGGMFLGQPPEVMLFPSRHLLGYHHPWFEEDGKAVIYSCAGCGDDGCESILAKISVDDRQVIWSDFDHRIACRSVEPNIEESLKFTFDRKQYEKELSQKYIVKHHTLLINE
jgi:hypothetical protein